MNKKFVLTQTERDSDLWRRLRAHFEASLGELRKQNDAAMGEIDTAALRGRIQQIKTHIALGDEPPEL